MTKEITWKGEKSRLLQVCRPCPCGCDVRDGRPGVGYLTGSDDGGNGFTVWIESEEVYQRLESCASGHRQAWPPKVQAILIRIVGLLDKGLCGLAGEPRPDGKEMGDDEALNFIAQARALLVLLAQVSEQHMEARR
ncbi:MAG: hypothetical protein C4567_04345 [Deltaproteobacteria bacterium]|nr:MAG: hypothetical protein C4567_04345 [Deltaproteobacteria bacterium]